MARILLVLATTLFMVIGYTAPADACGVKLTVKAPRVKKKVKPSDNPSRILLVGNPPRKLAASLSQAGHTVEVAENPSEANKSKRYGVVVADREKVEDAENEFPNAWVIPRSGSLRSNLREVESTLAQGEARPRRRRRAVARRSPNESRERQARESRPQPRRTSPGPSPEIARTATPDTDTESPSGVASLDTSSSSRAAQPSMVTVPRAKEPEKKEPEAKEPEDKPARTAARDFTFTEEFFFGPNSVRLNRRGRAQLAENARWLKQNRDVSLTIEGHTDAAGPDEYNMMLGERRAKTVRDFLVGRGVPRARVEIISYGEDRPAYSEDDDRNRRVVLVKQ